MLTNDRLIPTAVVMLVVGCTHPVSPRSVAEPPGHATRVQIGALEAYVLEDGHLVVPNDGQLLGFGVPPGETAALLAAAGLPRDTIRLDIQCLLVKAGDRVILFDAGTGETSDPATGHLPRSLALATIAPGAVTDIFITHAHSDHVGGLVTKAGARAFSNATIHLSAPEWAALEADPDDDSKRLVAAIATNVAAFQPGAQVLPIVQAVATPGHTVGHTSYAIGAAADPVYYLGDVVHHAVISVQHPAWPFAVDADRAAAAVVRQATLAKLAADHARVFVAHFPFPGLGHIVADGQGFAWKPEAGE